MSISSQRALAESKVGKTFGYLYIVKRVGTNKYRRATFLCRCECGKEVVKPSNAFTRPKISCGCKTKERQAQAHIKHGQCKRSGPTKAYRTWQSMIKRCYNPNDKSYKYYGAKGIKVCETWGLFDNFYNDMGDSPAADYELDRIDPAKNYEVTNCRWITKQENIRRVIHKRGKNGKFTK